MNQLIYAIILTLLPITELRVGLPVAVNYALENNLPIFPIFMLILILNILVIFLVFLFLDYLHTKFLELRIYRKTFDFYMGRMRKKADKVERRMGSLGFVALAMFVAIPLPGTGAWAGCLVAWYLGLDRKKSILAISFGIAIAALIILFASLGFLKFFSIL